MKAEIKIEDQKFNPIKIELTIESEQELCDLWHRFNASKAHIDKTIDDVLKHKSKAVHYELFNLLDKAVQKLNLNKK